ncbi:polysaccharide deacetylase family protein [Peptostreptococcus faecalis]|uniref:polysaccharide deacetylase family protein n=1 Tax=Peptostreptococcus faecalis TaxID=2045015 RepID=UPI000C7C4C27|nr:polysaccharide deacetylase family protein [Peptostreptococcus faecalis]
MSINNKRNKEKSSYNFKKAILFAIIIVSIIGCVVIGLEYKKEQEASLKKNTNNLSAESKNIEKEPIVGQRTEEKKLYGVDSQKVWNALNTYSYDNGGKKEVFLTFDDGPSLTNTPNILKILKENDVKATFFVMGKSLKMDGAAAVLKDTYNQGMAIANHSYSHDYKYLYPGRTLNIDNFKSDFDKNDKLIKDSIGVDNFSTRVIRCPGGQLSWKNTEPLSDYLIKNNKASIDWNSLNGDAEGPKKNAEQLYQEAVKTSTGSNLVVLLMHDTYGKEDTVNSLDKIIKYYKEQGYEFKTLV